MPNTFARSFSRLSAAIVLLSASSVMAQTTWINTGVGDWNTAANWNPASVPASGDSAIVTGGSAQINTAALANSVDITGDGVLSLLSGGGLGVNGGLGTVTIAGSGGSTGTLNFGSPDLLNPTAAGTLSAAQVTFGAGSGVINFNQNDDLTFSSKVSGNGRIVQQGSGTTMITNEVTLTSASSFEGVTKIKQGTLWVNGSAAKLTQSGATIEVGELSGDTGTLVVWNGAAVSDSRGYIGLRSGSQGTAIIHGADSLWQSSASLAVGYEGSGNLWIRQDALVTSNEGYVGFASGAFGDVVVESGGEWRTNGVLGFQVGRSGEGHLTLTTGGKMTAANGTGALTLATNSGSKGTLSFGSSDSLNPTTAGTLNASSIEGGNGEAAINFYQTDTVTLSMPISIGGTIKQQGSGTTVLNGEVFAGPVTVSAGTLLIGGTLTSEDVTVKNGGTLGGAGSIYFTVNLESGARLAPGNSIGTLSVNELNWNSGATLAFELGASTSDQIVLDLFNRVGTGAYSFQFLNAGWQIGQTYSLATFGSTNFNAGDFHFDNTGGFDGTFVINGNQLQFTLTAVPEPSTWILLGIAAGVAIACRRSRMISN